jgi:hypothetical protein
MAPKPPAPSDLADKFMLRLPDGMRDRIRDAADTNNRSMNAEIIARLEESFGPPSEETLRATAVALVKYLKEVNIEVRLDEPKRETQP